jgi:hypothetical protein
MHNDMTPAEQLLLLGARTTLSAGVVRQAHTLLAQPIDWLSFLGRAEFHRVAPLLHKTLPQLGNGFVPAGVREVLSRSYYAWTAKNLHLFGALRQVLRALQAAGVPVIVLKGAALAEVVYGSLALRPMSDLDLLVHREHLPLIHMVLEREGYALPASLLPPAYYHQNRFHLPYRSHQGNVLVEVHWQLQEALGVQQPDLAAIWREAVPARVAGVETWVTECENLLLYICLHLHKHGYYNRYLRTRPDAAAYILRGQGVNRLLWFCDLWEVLQRHQEELSWPCLVDKARRWGIEGTVYCSLDLLERLFGPSPAAPVLRSC